MADRRARPTVSVRMRVLLAVTAIAGAGMAVAGALTFLLLRDAHARDLDERLRANVAAARSLVAGTASAAVDDASSSADTAPTADAEQSDALRTILGGIVPTRYQSSIGLLGGRAAYLPGVDVSFSLDDPDLLARFIAETGNGDVVSGTADTFGRNIRYIAVPIVANGVQERAVYVTAFDLDAEFAELRAGALTFAVVSIIALAAIATVAWFVAGRTLRPIRMLNDAAASISGSSLDVRIPVRGNDDVSDLTRTINAMFDRLESAAAGQRRLLDDVRHELATPIAIMQGHLEVADPNDEAQMREVNDLVLDELDRMAGLVSDLQTLAGSEQALTFASVDVAELTRRVFTKASAIGGHRWELGAIAEARATADAVRITQAWLQLADNAAKFSPVGSTVTVGSTMLATAADRSPEVEFWVADSGPGVPDEARARIFERFGRAETGRGQHGSGLGLAIVSAIAAGHAGRVTLRTSAGGSRFGLVIPIERRAA